MGISTTCSSSLVAVHAACRSLMTGECDMALAGGIHLMLSPEQVIQTCRMRALSPDGRCKTFGFGVIGENPTEENPYGEKGNGIVNHFGMDHERDHIIYVSSLSKAYSSHVNQVCEFVSLMSL